MSLAISTAKSGVKQGAGGPFGAVIVQDDTLISAAHNEVIKSNDPSAHAEVMAIRKAATKLQTPHLTNCTLYTTCEPCPMCLGTVYWARISTIYFGCTNEDAGRYGFIDAHMHDVFQISDDPNINWHQIDREACLTVFDEWKASRHHKLY